MKRFLLLTSVLLLALSLAFAFGCQKKEAPAEQGGEQAGPVSGEVEQEAAETVEDVGEAAEGEAEAGTEEESYGIRMPF